MLFIQVKSWPMKIFIITEFPDDINISFRQPKSYSKHDQIMIKKRKT